MQRGRIHARTVVLQAEVSLEHGVTQADLQRLGLAHASLSDPEATVGRSEAYAHLELVHARGNFEAFTLDLARVHTMSVMGPVGMAARAMPTLREGLEIYGKYQHLVNGLATVEVVTVDDLAIWTEHRPGPTGLGAQLATEVSVVIVLAILDGLLDGFRPRSVELRRPDADVARYEAFCRGPVRTGAEKGRMTFDAHWLETPNPTADSEMVAYFEHLLEQSNRQAKSAPSVVLNVRRAVMTHLMQGPPTLSEVAKNLSTSARTLQRKLQEEGMTYAEVLDGIRRDLALTHLDNPQLTAGEVAYLVGYADTRSFHRAFRRWTGTSPKAFREQKKGA